MAIERQRENSRPSNSPANNARKRSLLINQRRYFIAAVALLSISSVLGLVTMAVNIVSSVLQKYQLAYRILYYSISGQVIFDGVTAVVLLYIYKRASSDGRKFNCFTILLPMLSSTMAAVGCLISTYYAVTTHSKIITDIFIINAGLAVVYCISAILSLLGILMSGQLWSVTSRIDTITHAIARPTDETSEITNPLPSNPSPPTQNTARATSPVAAHGTIDFRLNAQTSPMPPYSAQPSAPAGPGDLPAYNDIY
ncbi:hypothetical protein TrispH2_004464 [Trichoplax sp. H2]|nr:hypothetical protein TrispH2_004464 [Trichoplax sp. H2]|eukprot:RDD43335.1 hypothetical protein TrispH2_004464 [Trichoplax sp. H2]